MREKIGTTPLRVRLATGLAVFACALTGGVAAAQDPQAELDAKRAKLDQREEQKGVLSTELSDFTDRITQLRGEVAILRNREAVVAERLAEAQRVVVAEVERLKALRARLKRSIGILARRLVAIYKSDEPDALTVILDSNGFDDLVNRYEYLSRVQDQDTSIVTRVRDLRRESEATVDRVRDTRNEINARKEELERTRIQLEQREAALDTAREQKAAALDEVRTEIEHLEGDIGDLEEEVQSQLEAAGTSTTTSDPLPAGPVQGASGGWIWPVNGPVVSPYGMRWGRLHAGLDIAVPAGTPIRAAKDGTVVLASVVSGYGNYTCVDHGGGLSSCYAHQSSYATSTGAQVKQGQVIGYVGCTGTCYGDHLHFEIRVNGAPVDPLGYL